MRIARVFTSKNQYTPDDDLAFTDEPGLFPPEVDRVHVSCSFSWEMEKAEQLAEAWASVASVEVGGPAYDWPAGNFEPGMYLRKGYVITSRGCSKKCKFCFVRRREGSITTLPIRGGKWVCDNNLLACPRKHIEAVFDMLDEQTDVRFQGGFDVDFLENWHVERAVKIKPKKIYIAFDDDSEHKRAQVKRACDMMLESGIAHGVIHCFVLGGFGDDTIEAAEDRCRWLLGIGAVPIASTYRGPEELIAKRDPFWNDWQKRWAWQPGIFGMAKREGLKVYGR